VKASLQQFAVALVDVWSNERLTTPTGKQMKASDWAAQQGVHYTPSMLFFDQAGKEIFRTDALLKAFHIHAAMDYVLTEAYLKQPSFQRFVQERANAMRAEGVEPDLME
jgi:thioredoxin-related protein